MAKTPYLLHFSEHDRVQIEGFRSLFLLRLKPDQNGRRMDRLLAFATAIRDTSDDVFQKALEHRPELIKQWLKETTKQTRGRKVEDVECYD